MGQGNELGCTLLFLVGVGLVWVPRLRRAHLLMLLIIIVVMEELWGAGEHVLSNSLPESFTMTTSASIRT